MYYCYRLNNAAVTDILLGRAYERGRAKRAALEYVLSGNDYEPANDWIRSYETGEFAIDAPKLEVDYPPQAYPRVSIAQAILERWAKHLVSEGKRIDEYIDELLVGAIVLPFGFPALPYKAERQLTSVLNFRDDLRAYEREVEDFLEEVSMKASARTDVLPVTQILNQLQRTYDRAYDVCVLKVTTSTNTWMAVASLVVAVIAVAIAIWSGRT